MSALIDQLLQIFGIDFLNNPVTNLAEFIPFATKLLLGSAFIGMLYRGIFGFAGDLGRGKML